MTFRPHVRDVLLGFSLTEATVAVTFTVVALMWIQRLERWKSTVASSAEVTALRKALNNASAAGINLPNVISAAAAALPGAGASTSTATTTAATTSGAAAATADSVAALTKRVAQLEQRLSGDVTVSGSLKANGGIQAAGLGSSGGGWVDGGNLDVRSGNRLSLQGADSSWLELYNAGGSRLAIRNASDGNQVKIWPSGSKMWIQANELVKNVTSVVNGTEQDAGQHDSYSTAGRYRN